MTTVDAPHCGTPGVGVPNGVGVRVGVEVFVGVSVTGPGVGVMVGVGQTPPPETVSVPCSTAGGMSPPELVLKPASGRFSGLVPSHDVENVTVASRPLP
jgi:hypothetical protein